MAKIFKSAAAMGLILLAHAVTGTTQERGTQAPMTMPPLLIGAGDLLEVTIYDNPDLSNRFRVNENGDIVLPLAGPVHLEGETATEAGVTIEQAYVKAEILKAASAHATVFIAEYATQGILVNGEVRNPGLYPAMGVRTLNDVMTAAGGIMPTASTRLVITRKSDPDHPLTVEYDPDVAPPIVPRIQIFPGDVITVPIAGSVFVLGGVARAGIFVLEGHHTLTVEKAMALAGGTTHGANASHAHLVRTVTGGKKEDFVFNVNEILKGKSPDIALKDGDIVYVPVSNTKIALERGIESIIGVGTTVLTYRLAYQ